MHFLKILLLISDLSTSDINDVKFCNDGFDKETLFGIINDFYPIGTDEIGKINALFIASFYNRVKKKELEKAIFRHSSEIEKIRQQFYIPDSAKNIGIDFPTWINFDEKDKPRIMIVGIDPLRNKDSQGIDLGTPYALHYESMRNEQMKSYFDFLPSYLKGTQFI